MADAPHDDPTEGLTGDEQLAAGEALEGELLDEVPPAPAPGDSDAAGSQGVEGSGEIDFETLVADLERVATERDQFLDAYRRAQADFDNYRKQAARRHEDQVARSVGGLVERLLPVLDACDAALSHGVTEVEPIVAALLGTLEKEGLQRIEPKGEPFDPTVAEAVVHEPGGGGEQIVAEVMRAGYSWQGRVLRPAMVKVTD